MLIAAISLIAIVCVRCARIDAYSERDEKWEQYALTQALLVNSAAISSISEYDDQRNALVRMISVHDREQFEESTRHDPPFGPLNSSYASGSEDAPSKMDLESLTPFAKTIVLLRHLARTGDESIEKHLVGYWLKDPKTLKQLYSTYTMPRSITTGCPDKYFPHLYLLIRSVREIFKSDIPFEVFYMGPGDLSSDRVAKLQAIKNVFCTDMTTIFNQDVLKISSWTIKPFAILAARSIETMYMDADALFLQAPETFFDYAPYKETGALYFRDRFMHPRGHFREWLASVMPGVPSHLIDANEMAAGKTGYLLEGGLIVYDKRRQFWVLLLATILNDARHRGELYKRTYGDKEAYWMANMALDTPYAWGPQYAGQSGIAERGEGGVQFSGRLCHSLSHFDAEERLWWINDGLLQNKHNPFSGQRTPQHMGLSKEATWAGQCLEGTIRAIPEDQREILARIRDLYVPSP